MADVQSVTDETFEDEVTKADMPVLVDFGATWCGPCKQLAPIVEDIAKEYEGRLKVRMVDIDSARDTATRFGIMSVPTLLFFKNGEQVEQLVGLQTKTALKQHVDRVLA